MKLPTAAIVLAATFAGGMVFEAWLGKPKTNETPAPAVVQADKSVVVERKPDPDAKPKQVLPKGARVQRVGSVAVMPRISGPSPEDKESPLPVSVDWTLVQMPDETQRMIVSSPDGEIVGGFDSPVVGIPAARETKHTAIVAYNPVTRDALAGYTRRLFRLGPVTVEGGGMAVWQDQKPGAYALFVARW